ncbi:MAG: right-handed parallel beta-helix repeat-containing protein, partial [Candidatus Nanoarchaeia archaeon]
MKNADVPSVSTQKVANVFFVLFFLSLAFNCISANYYVATTGSDSNPGTEAQPWKTIQYAAGKVSPGDTVFVRGGVYSEQVNVTISGTEAGGYITFRNYAGETPVIDGTGKTPGTGRTALFKVENKNYIIIDGFEIRNYTANNANYVPCGILVTGYGSHISILNNTVHHIIQQQEATGNAHGIAVYATNGTSSINNLIVSGNTVRDCKLGWSESLVLNGNVEYFTVSGNTIHDNDNIGIDLIGYEGTAPANDQVRNGTVVGNTVYNITTYLNPAYSGERSAGGIYVDGGDTIVIEKNCLYACDIGIEIGCEHNNKTVQNIFVRNNLIYKNNVTGLAFGGYETNMGIVMNCKFEHNTLYMNDTTNSGTGEIMIQKSHDNALSNNIFYASSQNIFITNYFTSAYSYNNTLDYNAYYCPGGQNVATFVWKNTEYNSFSAYKTASLQDSHSIFVNPLFVNATSTPPNLQLQDSSPAINAGNPSFTPSENETDYAGNSRVSGGRTDCGAYEKKMSVQVVLTMAVQPTGAGNTNPAIGNNNVMTETVISISATPTSAYVFSHWTGSANATIETPTSSTTNVILTGNATVTANFSIKTLTVTFQTDNTPGADLSGQKSQTVNYGADCSPVTAIAPKGYRF